MPRKRLASSLSYDVRDGKARRARLPAAGAAGPMSRCFLYIFSRFPSQAKEEQRPRHAIIDDDPAIPACRAGCRLMPPPAVDIAAAATSVSRLTRITATTAGTHADISHEMSSAGRVANCLRASIHGRCRCRLVSSVGSRFTSPHCRAMLTLILPPMRV